MKIDAVGLHVGPAKAGKLAAEAEVAGYDGIWGAETSHDPFFPLLLAAEHTERLELGTAIAVAFARSPMTVATAAWDLQAYSNGRLNLGLGSQIQKHIESRFSMPWSRPVPRMREFIAAVNAIWDCWQTGSKLDFRGDFYQHTFMLPLFNPGALECGRPKVFLAAVGEKMTEVAGDMADGLLVHSFTTEQYLREVTLPTLDRTLAASGRRRADFQIAHSAFVVTGSSEERFAKAATAMRRQIAFYASTPAYRPVLDQHGWGELQGELARLSKQGQWREMGDLIDDTILSAFAVCGPLDSIAKQLRARLGDNIDRLSLNLAHPLESEDIVPIIAGLRDATQSDSTQDREVLA